MSAPAPTGARCENPSCGHFDYRHANRRGPCYDMGCGCHWFVPAVPAQPPATSATVNSPQTDSSLRVGPPATSRETTAEVIALLDEFDDAAREVGRSLGCAPADRLCKAREAVVVYMRRLAALPAAQPAPEPSND